MPSSTGLKAVEQMDGGCTSSAAVLRLSAYCTTSESECAVPGVPRNSMLSSSSCTGSANWSVLGVSPRQMGGGTGTESEGQCGYTVPSCILIVRMVCLSNPDSVIAFDIDEARRNLRSIKP
jgi:hypothetical protein